MNSRLMKLSCALLTSLCVAMALWILLASPTAQPVSVAQAEGVSAPPMEPAPAPPVTRTKFITQSRFPLPGWIADFLAAEAGGARVLSPADATATKSIQTSSGNPNIVYNGDYVTYTIVVQNGNAQIVNVNVIDVLPPDVLEEETIVCIPVCEKIQEVTNVPIIINIPVEDPINGGILPPIVTTTPVTITRQISWTTSQIGAGQSTVYTLAGRVSGQSEGLIFSNRAFVRYDLNGIKVAASNEVSRTILINQQSQAGLSPVPTWLSDEPAGIVHQDWGDFDRDGYLDLALAAPTGIFVYRNERGVLQKLWADTFQANLMYWADVGGDGRLELIAFGVQGNNRVYRYEVATRQFVLHSAFNTASPVNLGVVGRFTDTVDLILREFTPNTRLSYYKNNGQGVYTRTLEVSQESDLSGLVTGDFNNDGYLDLAYYRKNAGLRVLTNTTGLPGASFVLTTANSLTVTEPNPFFDATAFTMVVGDSNNDGFLDITALVGDDLSEEARLYANQGGQNFQIASAKPYPISANYAFSYTKPLDQRTDFTQFTIGNVQYYNYYFYYTYTLTESFSLDGAFTAIELGDFNGDGKLETTIGDSPLSIYSATLPTLNALTSLPVTRFPTQTLSNESAITIPFGYGYSTFTIIQIFPQLIFRQTTYTYNYLYIYESRKFLYSSRGLVNLRAVDLKNTGDLHLSAVSLFQPSQQYPVFSPHLSPNLIPIGAGNVKSSYVAWGDANGDGQLDLFAGATALPPLNSNIFFNQVGGFTNRSEFISTAFGPHPSAFGDVNDDGKLDLAIPTPLGLHVYLNGNFANPDWTPATAIAQPTAVAWGDANDDGRLDLLVGYADGTVALYLNQGIQLAKSPELSYNVGGKVTSLAWADINRDYYPDFAVASENQPARVYVNNKGVKFNVGWSAPAADASGTVAWAYLRPGGYPLLSVGGPNLPVRLFDNQVGVLSSQPITIVGTTGASSLAWADWNSKGGPVLGIGYDNKPPEVYAVTGDANLSFFLTWRARDAYTFRNTSIAWGDYNNDGQLDLAVGQVDGPSGVYRNTIINPSHMTNEVTRTMLLPQNPTYAYVARPGKTKDAYLYSSAERLGGPQNPLVTIQYRLFDPDANRASAGANITSSQIYTIFYEYSKDDGITWQPARAYTSPKLITATLRGQPGEFIWDAQADDAISDNARFRVRAVPQDAYGPVQRASAIAISPPFRVRGTTCEWPQNPAITYTTFTTVPIVHAFTGTVFAGNSLITYTWDFGDGSGLVEGQFVTHTYGVQGNYPVTLTVTGEPCRTETRPAVAIANVLAGGVRLHLPLITNGAATPRTTPDSSKPVPTPTPIAPPPPVPTPTRRPHCVQRARRRPAT